MTTIAGIQGDGFAVVCADSQISDVSTDGAINQIITLRESFGKIGVNGRYILGAAGDVRAINILHHAFSPPIPPNNAKGKHLDQFMTVKFIPALRECFEAQGYAAPQTEQSQHLAEHGSSIIVVVNCVIYIIESDYSWCSDLSGIYTLGSGAQFAMGALHALSNKVSNIRIPQAKQFLIKSLAAAAKFDPYTGAPYHTLVQGADKQLEVLSPTKNTKNLKKLVKIHKK